MAALPPNAERILADDPEGLAQLHRILHGRDPAPNRPVPTREEHFGRPPEADRGPDSGSAASQTRHRVACPD